MTSRQDDQDRERGMLPARLRIPRRQKGLQEKQPHHRGPRSPPLRAPTPTHWAHGSFLRVHLHVDTAASPRHLPNLRPAAARRRSSRTHRGEPNATVRDSHFG